MKAGRRGPRCRVHADHFVATPATCDDTLRGLPLDRWLTSRIPRRTRICCAACAHAWWTNLIRSERGLPPGSGALRQVAAGQAVTLARLTEVPDGDIP